MSFMYEVEYARNEQRKQFQSGYLITTPTTKWLWLKDKGKVTIRKGVVSESVMQSIVVGATFISAGYEILVTKAIDKPLSVTTVVDKPAAPSSSGKVKVAKGENDDTAGNASSAPAVRPTLDPVLVATMRPHQISAAKFLLARLLGDDVDAEDVNTDGTAARPTEDVDVSDSSSSSSSSGSSLKLLITGAILADDMGTGKTLTGLAVLWALIRHGRSKGIVVCPSSLVENWEREAKKWLPTSLGSSNCGLFASARDAEHKVGTFCSSAASVRPLLVISYDLFRTYADQFNRVSSLDVLVCDEGHRLKNACGTQTTVALGNCIAMRRLVLTGTPIQNNLDELYAVVNFASPGYLGTLAEFKAGYADAIEGAKATKGGPAKKKSASSSRGSGGSDKDTATQSLRLLLSKILLRRTRDTILKAILPPRTDFLLRCGMTASQQDEYLQLCDNVLLRHQGPVAPSPPPNAGGGKKRKLAVAQGEAQQEELGSSLHGILPALLQLRLCANSSSSCSATAFADTPEGRRLQAEFLLAQSGKMQVLDLLLRSLRVRGSEKVVIVSNFTSALDDVQALALGRGWHCLRIDGSVPSDKRMRQVNHFNSPDSPFFVMLLSAKAGGVGLNLVGGSRLVMLDPDWNPATDLQCMGRVWRDGQTKPVFIYRLISAGTIDETIVQRQVDKGALTSVIAVQGEAAAKPAPLLGAGLESETAADDLPEDEDDGGLDGEMLSAIVSTGGLLVEGLVLPRGRPFVESIVVEAGASCARQAAEDVEACVKCDPVLRCLAGQGQGQGQGGGGGVPIIDIIQS